MDTQSFLSWNVRGANSVPSRYLIRKLILRIKPAVLCLQETKCTKWSEKNIRSLGMPHPYDWLESPSVGQSGGLLTLWNTSVFSITTLKANSNWSLIRGLCILDNKEVLILNIYAPQTLTSKKKVWAEILDILVSAAEPYILLLGDFNAVCRQDEKANSIFCNRESSLFNSFIDSSGLLEVQMTNSTFTWFGPAGKRSKLDRALVSTDWFASGKWIVLAHDRFTSDHCPLSLSVGCVDWGPKPFKLFNCWLEDPQLTEALKLSWTSGNFSNLTFKFRMLRQVARTWNNEHYGMIDEKIKSLQDRQRSSDLANDNSSGGNQVREELDKLIRIKVGVLCQKSRLNWSLQGEKNTKFFHRAIARRRHSNSITSIFNGDEFISDPEGIKSVLFEHFKCLLSTPIPGRVFNLAPSLLPTLSVPEKIDLVKNFTLQEIEAALAATDGSKSPGPDGVNAGVLRSLWPVISADVLNFFLSFYDTHHIPRGYNSSFIVLIPKVPQPKLPSQFRPISLMNSIIKLLTKVLARRLRGVMDSLVGQSQSAFIQGRQISDSILIANEVIHSLQSKKSVGMVLKIDFEKAFDKIRWDFVFEVLRCMHFDKKWIDWITAIFESSRISVLVNGAPSNEFSPNQGLRQGDPLSPLLFNLVGEVLARLLDKASALKIITGISISSHSTPITHLQFADDVILFLKPDVLGPE